MDQSYYQALFQKLERIGYQAVRSRGELFFKKEKEDSVLLLRLVPETLPGQDPVDVDREHALADQMARDTMVLSGKKAEGILVLVRNGSPDGHILDSLPAYDDIWILDRSTGRLLIYEGQKTYFYGLEDEIENFSRSWEAGRRAEERKHMAATFTPVNTGLILANIIVFAILSALGDTNDGNFIASHGGMTWPLLEGGHRYYLLFTSMFVHFGVRHLGENMLMLLLSGRTLERHLGSLRYLILYLTSGLVSSLSSLAFTLIPDPRSVSAGASGAIFGVLGGLLLVILIHVSGTKRRSLEGISLRGIMFIILFSLGYGFTVSGVDSAAHLGGLVSGFVLTAIMEGMDRALGRSYPAKKRNRYRTHI